MTMKQVALMTVAIGSFVLFAACNFTGTVTINGNVDLGDACSGDDPNECGAGRFCKFAEGNCGVPGVVGFCEDIPEACTEIFMPVCGCDGMTYGNACFADMAGVSITDSQGGCKDAKDDGESAEAKAVPAEDES